MKQVVEHLVRDRIRNWQKIAKAVEAIGRLRRKPPAGWDTVHVLRKLRER